MTPGEWTALIVAGLAAVGGSGGIGSIVATKRAARDGISANERQARIEERRDRVAAKTADDAARDRLLEQLGEQLEDALARLREQAVEIDDLRQGQRRQFARDERQRAWLMRHAAWDFLVGIEVERLGGHVPEAPALMPPEDDDVAAARRAETAPTPRVPDPVPDDERR